MHVQEYLRKHGVEKLKEEFSIVVSDYPDRIVLNYNQIESPRFHPICDECRALILHKDSYEVMSRAFDRFYNVGEGEAWKNFPVNMARIDSKLDGTLISVYWDGKEWCVATRKMAFAEGQTPFGKTFRQLFDEAQNLDSVWEFLNKEECRLFTWIFELTSPENRVVTPYSQTKINLIGARVKTTGDEAMGTFLDAVAEVMKVDRPKPYKFEDLDEVVKAANSLDLMDEGFVLVIESPDGSHARLKCKNESFVAIAHMRDNGQISPRRILALLMDNEHFEYLQYFPEDKSYFDFVEKIYGEVIDRIVNLKDKYLNIQDQKEFALTIIAEIKLPLEKAVLFQCRKGKLMKDILNEMGAKKLAKSLNLKEQFIKNFKINLEEETEN